MADLQPVRATLDGGATSAGGVAASAGGDSAPVGDGRLLLVDNGGAAAVTVTAATPGTYQGLAVADATITVPVGGSGVLPLSRVLMGTDGRAAITYDQVDTVTVAVIDLDG